MLSVSDMAAGYGRTQVLHSICMRVDRGELVCVIGANGAGKSTLLRAVSGLIRVSAGSIVFDGDDVTSKGAHTMARMGLCHVPESRELFPVLSVADNLRLGAVAAKHRGSSSTGSYDRVCEIFPVLAERRNQRAGTLSGGEQQMLAIARALMGEPSLLVLDEPSLGLAPMVVEEIMRAINDLRTGGTAVLLVEQNAEIALMLADRAYVLERGRFVVEGKADLVKADPRVRTAYLGSVEYASNESRTESEDLSE